MHSFPSVLRPGRLALALVPFLLHSTGVLAQQGPAPRTLDTVRVVDDRAGTLTDISSTGSALGLSVLDTPASLTVILREQLNARGNANLNNAITWAGAISAMPHPGNGLSALSSRGFTDSASVMRLYDGIRQYGGVGVTFPLTRGRSNASKCCVARPPSSMATARSGA